MSSKIYYSFSRNLKSHFSPCVSSICKMNIKKKNAHFTALQDTETPPFSTVFLGIWGSLQKYLVDRQGDELES